MGLRAGGSWLSGLHILIFLLSRDYSRASLLASIPITAVLWLRDADEDFARWESMRGLREKRVPTRMMPVVVKYDWGEFEDTMIQGRAKRKLRDIGAQGDLEDNAFTGC